MTKLTAAPAIACPFCDSYRERAERAEAELAKWRELHRMFAEELGSNPEEWPDHGNAPLAIAATFMLQKHHAEKAEAERDALRADADRYRWLRDVGDSNFTAFAKRMGYSAAALDEHIDAALKDGK